MLLKIGSIQVGGEHPLFTLHRGREVFLTHRVDILWSLLRPHIKEDKNFEAINKIDSFLHVFVGDPRYPYPNKTPLTNQLVKMEEKVYLLFKLESGWLGSEEKKLLVAHLGKKGIFLPSEKQKAYILASIRKEVEIQEQKSRFALQLAESILKLSLKS